MFENNLIAGVSGQGGGYNIEDSLRFNDNDSAYLSRTPSVAGNRKTWTWSGWVKLGNITFIRTLFSARFGISNSDSLQIYVTSNDQLNLSGVSYGVTATPLLRDPSGWYHIVIAYDTTQATDTNRVKFYINGIQASATGTYPSLNLDAAINNTQAHNLGRRPTDNDRYFDGYMAEVNLIDGQALTADSFGQIDATTGEWSPKKYSGTYGTNGFYLPFNGNANDDSGNGNNWTENNLASTDYMIDTPTNNFATLNPLQNTIDVTYFEGNLKTTQAANYRTVTATQFVSSGKWYFEHYGEGEIGVVRDGAFDPTNRLRIEAGEYAYNYSAGNKLNNNVGTAYGDAWGATDITSCALDLDAGTIEFFKNNVSQGIAFTGLPAGSYTFAIGHSNITEWVNFGADSSFAGNKTRQGNTDANGIGDFYYTPPTGYLALCTDNLPAPAIEQPETQFNVVTYTGDGTTPQAITGVGFQPDLVWIKRRDSATDNTVLDSIRGDARLETNNTDAELGGNINVFSSFDSDGFTTGFSSQTGASGGTYVAWCWKAGGTAVTNTDGSITSQVSANVDAGFSIATFTGNGSTGQTIGHGLSKPTEFYIWKRRDSTSNWATSTTIIDGTADYFTLETTNAKIDSGSAGQYLPTSTTQYISFSGAGANVNGASYVCYSFHSVDGFSKFGSYVGNGSADGPFVYTGFKPAFVMIKAASTTGNWFINDTTRDPYNPTDSRLYPNLNNDESVAISYDCVSNGFKIRNSWSDMNSSGVTYIYMAFAEHPFNYATGR